MLRPADADLVRRDRDLPDLALLLDADRLAARLEQRLGHQRAIGSVDVSYLRYKPTQNCLAACRADVSGEQVDFVVKAYRPGAIDKFDKAMTRTAVPGPLGRGRFVLDNSNVLVSVFPNDRRLEHLARLGSPDSLAQLATRHGAPSETAARLETLRHNPERRFVGRLVVEEKAIATVRCYTGQDYARIVAKAGALRSRGPLRLARRLTRRQRWHLLTFEWLHGDLLEDAIRRQTASPSVMRVVGAALAELHGQEAPALPRRTATSEATALVALARQLAFLHPPIATSARYLAEHVAARLVAEPVSAQPLHGDFYAKQVLLETGTAALIDLDEAALGDPAIDLARFRADLEATALSGRLDVHEVEPLVEPLLEGYYQTRGGLPPNLNLHIAAQLLRVAAHPFRRREPSWPETAARILERAEEFLRRDTRRGSHKAADSVQTGRQLTLPPAPARDNSLATDVASRHVAPPPVVDPFGVTSDPLMPFLAQALNPENMGPRLAHALTCLNAADDIQVLGVTVTRHKPGRRCLIAYDLAVHQAGRAVGELAIVGKARARGTDTATQALLEMLWAGSFGASADDGVQVPEPLGIVRDVHMGLQRRVAGEPFTPLLAGPCGLRLARRAAEAIHKLHRASAPAHRRHVVDDELLILRERLTCVVQAHPHWHARIARLLNACMRLAPRVQDGVRCGIHRDFYPEQILVDGERLYLMDLDLYSHGDPALDIGNFVAHVEEYSLRRFGDPNHLADRNEMLIDRYLQLSGETTREAIHVWASLALARHVAISRLFADRRPFTAALLGVCERRIFGGPDNDREISLACGQEKGATP